MSSVRMAFPKRRRWPAYVIIAVVLLAVLFTFMSQFYVDLLWYREVDFASVFWTTLRTKVVLGLVFGVVFFALLYVNLVIVRRFSPTTRALTPDQEVVERIRQSFEPYLRWILPVGAAVLALLVGIGVSGQWQTYLLWKNSAGITFGHPDPLFGRDPAFYVFSLPWLRFLQGWLFSVLVGVTFLVAIAHFLWGGIQPQAPGGLRQKVDPAVQAHLSVLLGLIMLVKAWGYYLGRFDLLTSPRGVVEGASYTDVNAELPALKLPDDRRGDLRAAVLREHQVAGVGAPDHRGRSPRHRVGAARNGLPGLRAALPGGPAGIPARTALHQGQHRSDADGVRAGHDRFQVEPTGGCERHGAGHPQQPGHGRQRAGVASADPGRELQVAAADPAVLRLPRCRRRSIQDPGRRTGSDGLGAGGLAKTASPAVAAPGRTSTSSTRTGTAPWPRR